MGVFWEGRVSRGVARLPFKLHRKRYLLYNMINIHLWILTAMP